MKEIVKVLLQEGIDEETIHEVLNILDENIVTAIRKSDKSEEEKEGLRSKAVQAHSKERDMADAEAMKKWVKGERKRPDTDFERTETKNSSGERKTRLRSHHYDKNGFRK